MKYNKMDDRKKCVRISLPQKELKWTAQQRGGKKGTNTLHFQDQGGVKPLEKQVSRGK